MHIHTSIVHYLEINVIDSEKHTNQQINYYYTHVTQV
jgi:hypothetical protein